MQGTITYWNQDRAYGFIRTRNHGKQQSFFLHITEIAEGPLVPSVGARAEFEVAPAAKNGKLPNAVNAKVTGISEVQR